MKMVKPTGRALPLEALAEGFCMTVANAYRLVEDGERLLRARRFLGALGCFGHAVDEIVRAHLITKAAAFAESDEANWEWFWKASENRNDKLRLAESEIHPSVFTDHQESDRARTLTSRLRDQFVYVSYGSAGHFVPPGDDVVRAGDEEAMAKDLHQYLLRLFTFFNFHGLPSSQSMLQVFWSMNPSRDPLHAESAR